MYDDYIVTQIKELKENGKSYKEISKIMNILKASIWWIITQRKMQFIVNLNINVKLAKAYQ